jgi:replicative DNA helicase
VLLGPPTIGKTALAKQIADQVAQLNEVPVLFFTFVHSADDLRMRTLARIAGVELAEIMNGKTDRVMETFPKREMTRVWDLVEDAAKQYGAFGSRMQVIEAGRRTAFETLRQTAHDAKREAGADQILMVFDHLQAMPLAGGNSPDACGVDEICFDLRRLARSLNSPVLLVSSEAHEAYKGNRMPTLSALKSAEGMGYAADVILAMWEDQTISKRLTRESPGMRNVNLILLKNRRGNLAQFTAMFHPGTSRFMNLEKSDQPYDRFDAMQG